jgi:tetratricopeptide (TPR) repeat protein
MGLMTYEEGDYATARSLLEESISLHKELGDKFNLAIRINNLGNVALMQGDYSGARSMHAKALALRQDLGDKWGVAVCLVGIGGAAVAEGDVERGTRLLGAAQALLDTIGASLEVDDRIPFEQGIASARTQLVEESFERAWAEGSAMNLDQATSYALEG